MKRDRAYRSNIVSQIQTMVNEMRSLAPKETVDSILEAMHLETVDSSLAGYSPKQNIKTNILSYDDN